MSPPKKSIKEESTKESEHAGARSASNGALRARSSPDGPPAARSSPDGPPPARSASNGRPDGRVGTVGALFVVLAAWACALAAFVQRVYFEQEHAADLRFSSKRWDPLTDRLVVIMVDSVPFSMAFDPKNLPFVSSLKESSTYGMAWSEEPTMTSVMIETLTTGNRPFIWTVVRDWRMQLIPQETWLDGMNRAGLRLEAYGDIPWGEQTGNRIARHYTLAEEGKQPSGKPLIWDDKLLDMDPRALDALYRWVDAEEFDVLIWHIMGTDLVMHRFYRDNVRTRGVLQRADRWIRKVVDHLDDGRTTFLILSDHGCAANGRHGTSDPEGRPTFYLLYGPSIVAGQRVDALQVDHASTLLALFGLTPNAPNAGRPIVEALDVPWDRRADILLAAASQRLDYLSIKRSHGDAHTPPVTHARREFDAARRLHARGRHRAAAKAATGILRRLHLTALDARRQNRWLEPVLWWVTLGLALLSIMAALSRSNRTGPNADRSQNKLNSSPDNPSVRFSLGLAAALAGSTLWDRTFLWAPLVALLSIAHGAAALRPFPSRLLKGAAAWVVAGTVAAYHTGVTLLHLWTGRICNTLLFQHTKRAEEYFVAAVQSTALAGLVILFLLRKRLRPHLERVPFVIGGIACVVAAGFNGYYQGFYFPFLFGLFIMILMKGVPEGFPGKSFWARWVPPLLPLGACAGIFHWQTTWCRHFWYMRYPLDEMAWPGGLAAGAAFMLLCLSIRLFAGRKPPTEWRRLGSPGSFWAAGAYLAALVTLRHLIWPTPPEHLSLSLGHHLLRALPAQLVFSAACLPALWPALKKRELLMPLVLATAAAMAAVSGSPFESPAVLLLFALLLPLSAHPVFAAPHPLAVPAAAFAFLATRVLIHVVFDFKFNYTTVHDLLGFPADVTWTTWLRMLPSFALRQLPVTAVACLLFLRRMERIQILQTGLLVGLFWACRAFYIAVLMHLSREQLYLNWRNTGEAVHYALFFGALIVCVPLVIYLKRFGEDPKEQPEPAAQPETGPT